MFFKIIITCNNANSIIKELRPKNGHPHFFSESDLISEEPGALHRNALRSKGLIASSEYDKFYLSETRERVKQGDFPVMLLSPKALFAGQWRAIMSDEFFQERLHIIVVDEAHCITEW